MFFTELDSDEKRESYEFWKNRDFGYAGCSIARVWHVRVHPASARKPRPCTLLTPRNLGWVPCVRARRRLRAAFLGCTCSLLGCLSPNCVFLWFFPKKSNFSWDCFPKFIFPFLDISQLKYFQFKNIFNLEFFPILDISNFKYFLLWSDLKIC